MPSPRRQRYRRNEARIRWPVQRPLGVFWGKILVFLFGFAFAGLIRGEETKLAPFSIQFYKSKVALSGTADSDRTINAVADAILSVRPDLQVINRGLAFDPGISLPELKYLKSLITEVALSTHEGEIVISDDELLIGGLTDSVVTVSVLRLRAEPILGERKFRERICQVPTEDLPPTPIFLSNGESRKAFSFDLSLVEKKQVRFEPPGILLDKISHLISGTTDMNLLLTGESTSMVQAQPVSAVPPGSDPNLNPDPRDGAAGVSPPVEMVVSSPITPDNPSLTKANEVEPYEELGPILFARNSFLLQGGQRDKLDHISLQLSAPERYGQPVIVRSLMHRSGSKAFDDWLSKRRLSEIINHLTSSGIRPERLARETSTTNDTFDKGEVRILVERPEKNAESQ